MDEKAESIKYFVWSLFLVFAFIILFLPLLIISTYLMMTNSKLMGIIMCLWVIGFFSLFSIVVYKKNKKYIGEYLSFVAAVTIGLVGLMLMWSYDLTKNYYIFLLGILILFIGMISPYFLLKRLSKVEKTRPHKNNSH